MTPLHVGTSYTHDFGFCSKGNASATHQIAWAGSLKPQIAWAARGLRPLPTPINGGGGGAPPLKFPPYSLFRPKGGRKTINFFTHFHGFVPDTNYKHLECFVMLGTLSEPRTGQMSHICDISTLRVKYAHFNTFLNYQLLISLQFYSLKIMFCSISSSYKEFTSRKRCKLQFSTNSLNIHVFFNS